MSDVVGSLMVEAGLDLTKFDASIKKLPAITSQNFERMSAEMKRTTREGAESLRLIDEAIGLHLSRPLTRIIAQIPGVGTALSGVLGTAAFRAVAVAAAEFAEHISAAMEKAKKATAEYNEDVKRTAAVISALGASHTHAMKAIALELAVAQGQPGAKLSESIFKIDSEAAEQAKQGIAKVTEAMEKESKAAEAAGKWTTRFWEEAAYAWDNFWSSNGKADAVNEKFANFKRTLDQIMELHAADPLAGVRESLKALDAELSTTGSDIAQQMTLLQHQQHVGFAFDIPGQTGPRPAPIDSDALAAKQKYFNSLQAQSAALEQILQEETARRQVAQLTSDEYERQLKAAEALASLQREIGSAMAKFMPQTDPTEKLRIEIVGMKQKWDNLLRDMHDAGASPVIIRFATQSIDAAKAKADAFFTKFKQDAADTEAFRDWMLQTSLIEAGKKMPDLGTPATVMPHFTGNIQAQQLGQFAADSSAQWDLIKQAQENAISPLQKYADELARVNVAFAGVEQGSDLWATKLAAVARVEKDYDEATVRAESSTEKLSRELEQAESRADSAAEGIRAAMLQLQLDNANGRLAKAFSLEALSGFEDNTIKMLEGAKSHWAEYFRSLESMALKFAMNKALLKVGEDAAKTNMGKAIIHKLGLDKKTDDHAQLQALAAQMTNNTTATLANTAAIHTNTAAVSGKAGVPTSGGDSGEDGSDDGGDDGGGSSFLSKIFGSLTPHASGGDVSPGQGYLVGEEGPEPFFPGVSGSMLSNSSMKNGGGGGDTHIHNYDFSNFKGDAALKAQIQHMVEMRGRQAEAHAVVQSNERNLRTTTKG